MSKILGIDLGTTNCCAAVVEESGPRVLANQEGSRTTSSVVAFSAAGDFFVGEVAKRQALVNPNNTVFAVKRLIGRKFKDPDIEHSREQLPYSLVAAENGDIKVHVGDRSYSPEQVSSFILREIRGFAEAELGEELREAVITVPAHFNDAQRQATRDSGRLAGLDVLRIINEPTAAALAYGLSRRLEKGVVAVYDLGGGTFDVSILEFNEGVFEVRATAGDSYLGGEDFDQRLVNWLISEFLDELGVDLRQDRMALQRLKEAAERAKCDLSVEQKVEINLPFIATGEEGPRHLSRTLTREAFETLVEDLIRRTESPCSRALEDAGLRPDEVDEVLLVGGQTRTPAVARLVEKLFGRAPNSDINPDEVVAMGAAIQGGILQGGLEDVVLLDVTPLSLGVETQGGLFSKLIHRNATIPTKVTEVFTTVNDNQAKVEIHVLQGERNLAIENKSLGRFDLVGLAAAPRGVPQIEVTFAIDSNGIVNVSAKDKATKVSQSIRISPAGGLTREEVDRLVEEAQQQEARDREQWEIRRLWNRLDGLIYTNERVFKQFEEVLPQAERRSLEDILRKSRRALGGSNPDEVKEAMVEVRMVSLRLSEMMMDQVGGAPRTTES